MTFRVAPSHATQMKNSYLNNCETSTTQFLWLITAYAYDDGNSLTNNSFVTTSSSISWLSAVYFHDILKPSTIL